MIVKMNEMSKLTELSKLSKVNIFSKSNKTEWMSETNKNIIYLKENLENEKIFYLIDENVWMYACIRSGAGLSYQERLDRLSITVRNSEKQ